MYKILKLNHGSLLFFGTMAVLLAFINIRTAAAATLTSASIMPDSLGARTTNNVTVKFTTSTEAPNDARISVNFPAGFDLKNVKVQSCDNVTGTLSVALVNQQVKILGIADVIPAGTAVICILTDVKNPGPGLAGPTAIQTTTAAGVAIDTTDTLPNLTFINGILINATVIAYARANAVGLVGFDFIPTDDLPKDGKILMNFPAGFDLKEVTVSDCNLGEVTVTPSNQLLTISRTANPAAVIIPAGERIQCQFANIKHPAAGNTGNFLLRTANASGNTIDQLNVPSVTVFNGLLTNLSLTPSSFLPNTTIFLKVKFTISDALPTNGKVQVDFPVGFDASSGSLISCNIGVVTTTFSARSIIVTRSDNIGNMPIGSAISCEFGNIKTPGEGLTETFSVETLDENGGLLDYDYAIPGFTITATGMPSPGPTPPPTSSTKCAGFSDVLSTDLLCPAVKFVNDKGIFSGYPNGTFQPNKIINRVETTKVVLVGFGKTLSDCVGNDGFSDSDKTQWYCKYVHTAKLLGILKGYADGTLRPTQQINRVEMLKVFFAAMGKDLSAVAVDANPYPDALKNQWYAKYVQFAKTNALVDAAANGNFNPSLGMKRGDVALLFYRAHLAEML